MLSRLNETKRQGLVLEALQHVQTDVRVRLIGRAEAPDLLRRLQEQAARLPAGTSDDRR